MGAMPGEQMMDVVMEITGVDLKKEPKWLLLVKLSSFFFFFFLVY